MKNKMNKFYCMVLLTIIIIKKVKKQQQQHTVMYSFAGIDSTEQHFSDNFVQLSAMNFTTIL